MTLTGFPQTTPRHQVMAAAKLSARKAWRRAGAFC